MVRDKCIDQRFMYNHSLSVRERCYLNMHIFKGTVARDFFCLGFFMDLLFRAPDFEAKRIFFSLSFSRSYLNISMNPRSRLLQGFKISAVAYCAYCHSPMLPTALMYNIIFAYKSAM
jgi:hypothetical protein